MCEHFIARASEPFRLDELWPFTEALERYGVTGFGWGAAWITRDGALLAHRDTRAFRDDPDRDHVGASETTAAIVHLRRPSKLSTIQLADTQPFVDPAGRFAFSHNGELTGHRADRARYAAQGRITGRADSEVGQRWLEDEWADPGAPDAAADADRATLLCRLHERFGGVANLTLLAADGTPYAYAGNPENPVFSFRLGRIGIVSTAVYSIDRSLFRLVAPGATDRRLVRQGRSVVLDHDGVATIAS